MRQRVEEQQRIVEGLQQEIQAAHRQAERELEREQAHLRQQHAESKDFPDCCVEMFLLTLVWKFYIRDQQLHLCNCVL